MILRLYLIKDQFSSIQEGTTTNDQRFFRQCSESINRTALIHFFGILLFALALASPPAAAAEVTVNPGESIQAAVDAADPGDIVLVPAGTYEENVTVTKNITLRGSEGAVLNGRIAIFSGADGATVEHLTVNGVANRPAIDLYQVTGCTVRDNTLTGESNGIRVDYECSDCLVSGNRFEGFDFDILLLWCGSGNEIIANTCSGGNYGFKIKGCTGSNTLRDNIVLNANGAIIDSPGSLAIVNLTVDGGSCGVILRGNGNLTLTNSTITGASQGLSFDWDSCLDSALIANNLFNNTENVEIKSGADLSTVRWNTTKTAGENIRGGSFLGGNLWLTPDGTGFSQTHADLDLDGICDEGYAITDRDGKVVGTDNLPLQNGGPSANFTVTSPAFMPGVPVSFNDTSVGAPTSWSWTFGDETETTRNVTRIYDTVGTYQATLTVANAFGTNTTTRAVTIEPISIQGAVNIASEGDVVLVPAGTYEENVTVDKRITLSGDAGATVNGSIYLKSAADGAVVENLTVNGVADTTAIVVSADDAVVRGCTVSGGPEGIFLFYVTNCTVEGCTVSGGTTGINLYSSGQCRVLDNRVAGSGDSGIHLYNLCPECVISGNIVRDCGNTGISLWAGSQGSEVVANTCSDNEFGFVVSGCTGATTTLKDNTALGNSGPGILVSNSGSVVIENVTVHGNQCGVRLSNRETVTLTNSTLTGATGSGLEVNSASSSLIANNLFNNTKNINIWSDTGLTGTRWNTTKTFGKNIRGGPFLGGNYWLTPDGAGFSETHEDRNGDGICDESYDLGNGCIDHLPLHTCLPTANFTAVPTGGIAPLTVKFTDASYGVPILSRSWDFGDNSPAVDHTRPSHTFSTNGTYQVTLTVTNAFGSDTTTATVAALDPPTAVISTDLTEGNAPLTVAFIDDSTGCVFERLWKFDDGATSTEATLSHTFADPGTYTVTFNASNPYASDEATVTVVVHEVPTAGFDLDVSEGNAPLKVGFTDTSTGNVTSCEWDFGDGNVSTDQNPSHEYVTPGTYTVVLNASNAYGFTTAESTVTVLTPPVALFGSRSGVDGHSLAVAFTDRSSGNITAWEWEFGDDTTSTDPNPVHTYEMFGTYTVTLTVRNAYDANATSAIVTLTAPSSHGGRSPASAGAASHIPSGGHASFGVRDAAIHEVEVTTAEAVSHILVTVEPTAKPNGIEAPAAAVYEYDEVTLYHTTDEALAGADLNFTVTKAWLGEQGSAPEDVVLYRYHEGAWHALTTRIVGEDEYRYSFTAGSPGFSLFAIGVEVSGPAPTVTPAETVTALPVTTAATPATTTPQQSPVPFGLAALATGAALLIRGRRG